MSPLAVHGQPPASHQHSVPSASRRTKHCPIALAQLLATGLGDAQATGIQQREQPPHPVVVGARPGGVLRHRRDAM